VFHGVDFRKEDLAPMQSSVLRKHSSVDEHPSRDKAFSDPPPSSSVSPTTSVKSYKKSREWTSTVKMWSIDESDPSRTTPKLK